MTESIKVGLLDSGPGSSETPAIHRVRAFAMNASGTAGVSEPVPDPTGHGTAMAMIIANQAPVAQLLVAQVFAAPGAGSAAVIAAGLAWLTSERVAIINMSFGLRRDRCVLRDACHSATEAGIVLVAAAPARGPPVFPAAYPGVIAATGDARCAPGEIAHLDSAQATFAACPQHVDAVDAAALVGSAAGASCGAAYLSATIATYLASDGRVPGVPSHLRTIARYRGPERRT